MSSVHVVAVWEWQSGACWLPHSPGVSRTLERAHAKRLTRVVLADAEPRLRGTSVNLRSLTQAADEGGAECRVRRALYSLGSAGGRGLRWEWARAAAEPAYEPLPMDAQGRLEDAWAAGRDRLPLDDWLVCLSRLTARAPGGALRLLRRRVQPPYPLAPAPAPPPPARAPLALPAAPHTAPRSRIPQQHTGSSVQSAPAGGGGGGGAPAGRGGARSASPRDRKPGLARQILHNLNIFSHSSKPGAPWPTPASPEPEEPRTDTESGSTRSGRRHSVDTVSTYLSHESKDSLQQASVGELLNCSGGSDDVFEAAPAPNHDHLDSFAGGEGAEGAEEAEGVEGLSWSVCAWVSAAPCPQWGALCPACLRPLRRGAEPAVALRACQHLLHLRCLQDQLRAAPAYTCRVCGLRYGPQRAAAPARVGAQPPGDMSWVVRQVALPAWPRDGSILVTYSFQSGVQTAEHPAPGAPYYAVGFPRHTLLPDTPLGRQVLAALAAAWEAGALFTVSASLTTGREHVVAWALPPPPAERRAYAAPPAADRLLRALLQRLRRLLP